MSDTGCLPAIEILGKAAPNVPCESLRSLVSRQSRISTVSYLVSPQLQSLVSPFLRPALRVTALQVSASPGRHEGESGRVCEAVRDTDTGIHRTCRLSQAEQETEFGGQILQFCSCADRAAFS